MSGSTDPNIILQAGTAPLPDLMTQQQIASNQMTLAQQQKAAQAQNALRALYKNPVNLTPSGGLTGNALRQVMQIDPATGLQMSEASSKVADAQTQVATDQRGYITDTILAPSMEAYQNALKTMPSPAAMAVAQQVYAAGLQTAGSSGIFSQDQVSQMPRNFDPVRVGANVQNYSDYQANQLATSKLAQTAERDEDLLSLGAGKLAVDAASDGLPPPPVAASQKPGGPITTGQIISAFSQQESNGNPNAPTSSTGATGQFQIEPATFQLFASPGEKITNHADNQNVASRALSYYAGKYNNDPARVAVAYFSGPGNVAPAGSPTPWINDSKDPSGKSVSSYVSDITSRLGGSGAKAPAGLPQPNPKKPWTVMTMPGLGEIRYQPDTGAATTLDGKTPVDASGALGKLPNPADQPPPADDPGVSSMAKMIANYQMPPLSGYVMKTAYGQAVMAQVAKLSPDYQAADFPAKEKAISAFDSGPQGNSVRSFNVGISHLNTLQQLADALGNGNVQLVNKIGNQIAQQTGSPAPTNFDAAKAIVGDEIIKAIVGGGGALADRENAQNQIDNAKSPAQLAGVIDTYKKLMAGQLGGLQQQFTSSTGLPATVFQDKLYPDTLAQLQTDQTQPAGNPSSGVPLPPPAPGTVDGGYKFNGGDPSDPKNWTKQ